LRTGTVALHSGTWFSTVPHIIPASQVLSKTQLLDSGKDFPKERLRHSHFRHLKYHVAGMADHLGSYLDELVSERSQGPLFH
jgi:hypothetical protein